MGGLHRYEIMPNGCWEWRGPKNPAGYGLWTPPGERAPHNAYRSMYELMVGPVPEGMELDHTCHSRAVSCVGGAACKHRACINPAHLEPVSHRENMLRGDTFVAEQAARTHCPLNHPLDDENTYRWRGHRRCKECNRAACRRAYMKRKDAANA